MLLCLQYSKGEEARFLSHLDLMRAMERALRRARLPLAFSEGYNPHPRVAYASALAVGVTSEGEYLDLELEEDLSAQEVVDALSSGKLVVAIMSKGHFTSSGHFIVLRGVTSEGKILVADPASYKRSGQEWDLSLIMDEARKGAAAGGPFWAIGK